MKIFSGSSNPELAKAIASHLSKCGAALRLYILLSAAPLPPTSASIPEGHPPLCRWSS